MRIHCQKSTCTEVRRRGTAEIELVFSVVVLICIFMLLGSGVKLMLARLEMVQTADFQAMQNATAGGTPQYTDDADMPAIDGIGAVQPGLPNRMHVPRPNTSVTVNAGNGQTQAPVQIGSYAAVGSPSWTYSAWPVGSDQSATEQWFESFADESHSELVAPLGLAPVWTP